MSGNHIASTEVLTIFQEEVAALEGTISSAVHCRDQLLVRALLPYEGEVRNQDKVQGGVAARTTDQGVLVYPYVLRQVCRNGQMMPYYSTQDSTVVECNLSEDPTAYNLREAIRRSGHIATFCDAVASFKLSAATNIDMEGIRAAALGAIEATRTGSNGERRRRQVERIFHRFFQREEPTRFGFMNAVTRIARDTDEQVDRWTWKSWAAALARVCCRRHSITTLELRCNFKSCSVWRSRYRNGSPRLSLTTRTRLFGPLSIRKQKRLSPTNRWSNCEL